MLIEHRRGLDPPAAKPDLIEPVQEAGLEKEWIGDSGVATVVTSAKLCLARYLYMQTIWSFA